MGILFILAIFLAWPTYGLSILAWFGIAFLKKNDAIRTLSYDGILSLSAHRIASKAASPQAFAGGVSTAFTATSIEAFFEKFGTTEKKFRRRSNPELYYGYIETPDTEEFLAVFVMEEKGSVVASFRPAISTGEDVLGLMQKKFFADDIVSRFAEVKAQVDDLS
ncbi:hypothetical protein [Altererythrobacter sp. GH1-8]|uniref:hypothetical protein n=1 Tax=Altererythrobacter sp. GH1-8 TaxID=3349333 RepID=UPI00374C9B7E